MGTKTGSEYRLVRGSIPRRIRGIEARQKISRELHGIVIATPTPPRFADWWYDLRRGQLRVYGGLLRFIDLLVMSGAARETVLRIPQVIMWYCADSLDARDGLHANDGNDMQPPRAA